MAREGSPERGGWQAAVVVGRLACAEAGKLGGMSFQYISTVTGTAQQPLQLCILVLASGHFEIHGSVRELLANISLLACTAGFKVSW